MFNHVAMTDEFLSTQTAFIMIAHMFVFSCFMLTQVIMIAKNLSTLITNVNLTAMSSGEGSLTIWAQFGQENRGGVFKTRNNSRCNSVTVNTPLLQLLMNLL